jgi:hypothetical protein
VKLRWQQDNPTRFLLCQRWLKACLTVANVSLWLDFNQAKVVLYCIAGCRAMLDLLNDFSCLAWRWWPRRCLLRQFATFRDAQWAFTIGAFFDVRKVDHVAP